MLLLQRLLPLNQRLKTYQLLVLAAVVAESRRWVPTSEV